jgi:hypothetical protein
MHFKAVFGAALLALGATSVQAADHEFKLHHFLGEKAPAHSKMLVPGPSRWRKIPVARSPSRSIRR